MRSTGVGKIHVCYEGLRFLAAFIRIAGILSMCGKGLANGLNHDLWHQRDEGGLIPPGTAGVPPAHPNVVQVSGCTVNANIRSRRLSPNARSKTRMEQQLPGFYSVPTGRGKGVWAFYPYWIPIGINTFESEGFQCV